MKFNWTKTIAIGGHELPIWIPVAAGIALLLTLILTGEGPSGNDWVDINSES